MILYKLKSDLQMTPDLILSLNLVKMALNMAGKVIIKKQLSQNTAIAIHTCNGIVSLCQYLLTTSHKYVYNLGNFQLIH